MCFLLPVLIEVDTVLFFIIALALIAPMALDGLTQYWKIRKSNNSLRFTTGVLAGMGTGLMFGRIIVDVLIL